MNQQHCNPCAECPFARTAWPFVVDPSALGGSLPEVYIGQVEAGFALPCHMRYDDPQDAKAAGIRACATGGQCAGAAIFRGNLGKPIQDRIPLVLPPDMSKVFHSYVDFEAHHRQCGTAIASLFLMDFSPAMLADVERSKAGVQHVVVDRATGRIASNTPEGLASLAEEK